ncbi:DUF202 domain-containing protein [Acinetobacter johnsonii]|uniref:DUF202 domain-containing protein n=1 Tax=Acinetobacter johnsonii TaxID=40214 RepID=UPI00244B8F56|nr:DUF202 domain-containing protein [Acinetobacter johnsonii]MDH1531851.1 DUF202 domain-containing protein [Acinetobacter johnsonii]
MQDNGLQPERTFLSLERSLFSYIIINFTFFKILISKPSTLFYIAIFVALIINFYYFTMLINFKKITTLSTEIKNSFIHRLLLLSSGVFTIILAIFAMHIIYL